MKRKCQRVLTAIVLVFLLTSMTAGLALAQEQVKININKATVGELLSLRGIGPSYAQRIVDYRNEHGPYQNL